MPPSPSSASLPPPSATQPLTLQHGFNYSSSPASPSSSSSSGAPLVTGSFDHPLPPTPRTKGQFPAIDWLSCYAIAVNEVNAGLMIEDSLAGAKVSISATIIMDTLFGFSSDAYYRDVLVLVGFFLGFALFLTILVLLRLRELR